MSGALFNYNMRFYLITLVLAGVILSAQQANFRFDDLDREAARNIAFHSSYWLSNHPQLDPNDNHRLVINGGFSFYFRMKLFEYIFCI